MGKLSPWSTGGAIGAVSIQAATPAPAPELAAIVMRLENMVTTGSVAVNDFSAAMARMTGGNDPLPPGELAAGIDSDAGYLAHISALLDHMGDIQTAMNVRIGQLQRIA